jgi:RNA recognition motif-containing protein
MVLAELRRTLYSLFSQHGRIMDVVALKTRKMRGQAFVVFSTIASATAAMHAQNGAKTYGRPMVRPHNHACFSENLPQNPTICEQVSRS